MIHLTRRVTSMAVAAAVAFGGLVLATSPAVAADLCSTLGTPVYRTINPKLGAQLLTPWSNEYSGSRTNYGFTDDRGILGYGSLTKATGTTLVYRLYNPKTVDFLWVTTDAEMTKALASGYVKQSVVSFYAPTTASSCTVAVHRLVKGSDTRNAWSSTELISLKAAGWTDAGTTFYLKSPTTTTTTAASASPTATATAWASPTATAKATATASATATATSGATTTNPVNAVAGDSGETFSIAVIGDTQAETDSASDPRFANRTAWLAANKDALDLRYVLHTGDMVDWGWLVPSQFTVARSAMANLTKAGIPWSVTIGNHDTRVVGWNGITGSTGYGGAGYASNPECPTKLSADQCKAWLLVRQTSEFNTNFPVSSLQGLGGTFESGKIDNNWTTFTAGGAKWLVLTLELDPRNTVVDWARNVVATHPDHNVIIQTHHYLDGGATISSSNDGYGTNSGKYIYDQIVSKYTNVKIVLSGHVGGYTSRTDTNNGNTTVSYLGNELGAGNNPVRILTINTTTGKITNTVYNKVSPTNATTYTTGTNTISIIK